MPTERHAFHKCRHRRRVRRWRCTSSQRGLVEVQLKLLERDAQAESSGEGQPDEAQSVPGAAPSPPQGRDLLVTREVLEGTRGVLQAALDGLQHDDGSDDRVVSPISRRRRQSRSPKRPQ